MVRPCEACSSNSQLPLLQEKLTGKHTKRWKIYNVHKIALTDRKKLYCLRRLIVQIKGTHSLAMAK